MCPQVAAFISPDDNMQVSANVSLHLDSKEAAMTHLARYFSFVAMALMTSASNAGSIPFVNYGTSHLDAFTAPNAGLLKTQFHNGPFVWGAPSADAPLRG